MVINSVSDIGSINIESENSPERYDCGETLVLRIFWARFGPILLKKLQKWFTISKESDISLSLIEYCVGVRPLSTFIHDTI